MAWGPGAIRNVVARNRDVAQIGARAASDSDWTSRWLYRPGRVPEQRTPDPRDQEAGLWPPGQGRGHRSRGGSLL